MTFGGWPWVIGAFVLLNSAAHAVSSGLRDSHLRFFAIQSLIERPRAPMGPKVVPLGTQDRVYLVNGLNQLLRIDYQAKKRGSPWKVQTIATLPSDLIPVEVEVSPANGFAFVRAYHKISKRLGVLPISILGGAELGKQYPFLVSLDDTAYPGEQLTTVAQQMAFSPDEKYLAVSYLVNYFNTFSLLVVVYDLSVFQGKYLISAETPISPPVFSADSKSMILVGGCHEFGVYCTGVYEMKPDTVGVYYAKDNAMTDIPYESPPTLSYQKEFWRDVTVSAGGVFFASALNEYNLGSLSTVEGWRLDGPKPKYQKYLGDGWPATEVAFSHDQKTLAVVDDTNPESPIRIFDVEHGYNSPFVKVVSYPTGENIYSLWRLFEYSSDFSKIYAIRERRVFAEEIGMSPKDASEGGYSSTKVGELLVIDPATGVTQDPVIVSEEATENEDSMALEIPVKMKRVPGVEDRMYLISVKPTTNLKRVAVSSKGKVSVDTLYLQTAPVSFAVH